LKIEKKVSLIEHRDLSTEIVSTRHGLYCNTQRHGRRHRGGATLSGPASAVGAAALEVTVCPRCGGPIAHDRGAHRPRLDPRLPGWRRAAGRSARYPTRTPPPQQQLEFAPLERPGLSPPPALPFASACCSRSRPISMDRSRSGLISICVSPPRQNKKKGISTLAMRSPSTARTPFTASGR